MLDHIRFRRLYNVYSSIPYGTDNVHERDTARRMAERMASKEGMTLAEAEAAVQVCEPDRRETMDARPRQPRQWPAHPLEQALRTMFSGKQFPKFWLEVDECDEHLVELARNSIEWPNSFEGAIAELNIWDQIWRERRSVESGYDFEDDGVNLRVRMLEEKLKGRAETPDDVLARLKWCQDMDLQPPHRSFYPDVWLPIIEEDTKRLVDALATAKARLREARAQSYSAGSEKTHRSNFDKRQAVLDILATPEGNAMTLREIAERAGVHHATVANIKSQMERASNFGTRQRH